MCSEQLSPGPARVHYVRKVLVWPKCALKEKRPCSETIRVSDPDLSAENERFPY